ncbi:MAG: methyltransferase [Caulobacteraceae bacterium]|nr:methyltransferase [Caulobacteraceae bacterium]
MISRRWALGAAAAFSAFSAAAVGRAFAQTHGLGAPGLGAPAFDDDPALVMAIGGPQRSAANKARDGWRHPLQSLDFWGLAPGLTVIDIDPGGGYWTEILGPYLAQGGGHYLAGLGDPDDPDTDEGARRARAAFAARYGAAAVYGPIGYVAFSAGKGLLAPPASADMILFARYVHDLVDKPGAVDRAFASFYAALAPGGVLALEEHRSDPRAMLADASDGYVSEDYVIAAAAKAGFALAARSEINANPKDSKDHPFGVWTLPPTRRSAPEGQPPNPAFDHAKFDAIGESDRMTLRFVKPR